jgi:hypothetical protein
MSDFTRAIQRAVKALEGPDGWCDEEPSAIAARVAELLGQDVTSELERMVPVVMRRMAGYRALLHRQDPPPPAWSKSLAEKQAADRQEGVEVIRLRAPRRR